MGSKDADFSLVSLNKQQQGITARGSEPWIK